MKLQKFLKQGLGLLLLAALLPAAVAAAETEEANEAPVRVGNGVSEPVLLERVEPQYSEAARKARVTGAVVIEAVIDRKGKVTHLKVLRSLPYGIEKSVTEAVRQWRYSPAQLQGKPVAVYYQVVVKVDTTNSKAQAVRN
jgi:TonB family protein